MKGREGLILNDYKLVSGQEKYYLLSDFFKANATAIILTILTRSSKSGPLFDLLFRFL
jgi:hypothetical protein